MMLSPETVVEMELGGKSPEKVLAWIRGARRRLLELKLQAISRDFYEEEQICPSLQVQIDVQREYIMAAKEYYRKLGGEYVPSTNEIRKAEFEEAIPHIRELSVEFAGVRSGGERRTFIRDGEAVKVIRDELSFNEMKEFLEDVYDTWSWEDVLHVIRGCYLSEWKHKYVPHDMVVLDGDYWKVEIRYDNGLKKCKFEGSNCFPYSFRKFLTLLEWNI